MAIPFVNTTVKPCVTFAEINCLYMKNLEFYSQESLGYVEKECPLECNTLNFLTQTSSATYPTRAYYELLKASPVIRKHYEANLSKLTYDDLSSKVLMLNIYYRTLTSTKIYQAPAISSFDLIGNFGGILGFIMQ
jgi:hypothetical protein